MRVVVVLMLMLWAALLPVRCAVAGERQLGGKQLMGFEDGAPVVLYKLGDNPSLPYGYAEVHVLGKQDTQWDLMFFSCKDGAGAVGVSGWIGNEKIEGGMFSWDSKGRSFLDRTVTQLCKRL